MLVAPETCLRGLSSKELASADGAGFPLTGRESGICFWQRIVKMNQLRMRRRAGKLLTWTLSRRCLRLTSDYNRHTAVRIRKQARLGHGRSGGDECLFILGIVAPWQASHALGVGL